MIESNPSRKIGCYIRVSTDNQLDNYSIEEQSSRLKSYCAAKGWDIHKLYIDGGFSGSTLTRPGLTELIEDINNKEIQAVLVYKLDRLSRSQKDTLTLIEDVFLSHHVDFISLNENFDTSTPFGKAMIGILSVFAQLEKDQITERFTMGRIGRAKNGLYHGGPTPPTGYDYINSQLVINPYEAKQVKKVYELFLKGDTIHSIKDYMHKTFTTKHGNWSSHTLVLNVLRNEIYIGNVKFKGQVYPGIHQSIIDVPTFNQVQELLKTRHLSSSLTTNRSLFTSAYLLSGFLYCTHCGAKYSANHGFYTCYSRGKSNKKMIKDPHCKNKKWPIKELDHLIIAEIKKLPFAEDMFSSKTSSLLDKSDEGSLTPDTSSQILQQLQEQKNRLLDLYQWNLLTSDDFKYRNHKLQKQIEATTLSKMNQDNNHTTPLPASMAFPNLVDLLFESGPLKMQREFIGALIRKVLLDDHQLIIYWNFYSQL